MKFVQTLVSLLTLYSVIVYLFRNVFSGVGASSMLGDHGVAYGWLAIAVALGIVATLLRCVQSTKICVNKSAVLLAAFILYFFVKVALDLDSAGRLKAYMIGTTGGVLFGCVLGFVGAISVQGLLVASGKSSAMRRFVSVGLLSFICVYAGMLLGGYFQIRGDLQASYLLVADTAGYQRSGNFLSMIFLLVSLTVVCVVYINKRYGSLQNRFVAVVSVVVYAISVPLLMLVGQMLDSNSALFFTGVAFVVTAAFILIGLRGRGVAGKRTTLWRVIGMGVSAMCIVAVLSWGAINFFGISTGGLRITNFGRGGKAPSSVSSRLTILETDYLAQLEYEPAVGNMDVDTLTTGTGTYAHSLPLSLLSHLGIVGFSLFVLFLALRLRELRKFNSWCGTIVGLEERQRNFQLFLFCILLAVVLIATVEAFFVWLPLWFALGLLAPPLTFSQGKISVHSDLVSSAFVEP